MTPEQLALARTAELLRKVKKTKTKKTETNGGETDCDFEQIAETQLLSYLKAGWQVVHKLSDGQIIVQR